MYGKMGVHACFLEASNAVVFAAISLDCLAGGKARQKERFAGDCLRHIMLAASRFRGCRRGSCSLATCAENLLEFLASASLACSSGQMTYPRAFLVLQ